MKKHPKRHLFLGLAFLVLGLNLKVFYPIEFATGFFLGLSIAFLGSYCYHYRKDAREN